MIERPDLNRLVAKLAEREGVIGVGVLGSFARGDVRPGSDLDIVVLMDGGAPYHIDAFEYAGYPTEVFFVREDVIRAELDSPKGLKTIATWAGGEVLHDTDGRLSRLLDVVNHRLMQGPPPMSAEDRIYGRFELTHAERLVEEATEDEALAAQATVRLLISHTVRTATGLLLQRERCWPVGLRGTLSALRAADPASADLAETALTEPSDTARFAALELIDRVRDQLGGPLDNEPSSMESREPARTRHVAESHAKQTASARISLRPITRDNLEPVCRLKVADDQREFVESNLGSIAEAYVEPTWFPLAIYGDDEPVGFTMYGQEPSTARWWIIRLMVDEQYQGRGYGREAVRQLVQLMRQRHGCTEIVTSFVPGNRIAERLYENLGFRRTGEIDEGEIVMLLDLTQEATG